jgi:hypothetical protein
MNTKSISEVREEGFGNMSQDSIPESREGNAAAMERLTLDRRDAINRVSTSMKVVRWMNLKHSPTNQFKRRLLKLNPAIPALFPKYHFQGSGEQ